MSGAVRLARFTFRDFCVLVKDGQKADLLDGVIYMASPDNTDANALFMWLGGLIHLFAEARDLGQVYGSRVAFRLTDRDSPEPDIAFVRRDRLHLVQRGFVEGPPDLAVEIVSPDSVERDYQTKRELYRVAGVREYWIVDESEQRVLVLSLDARRRYREVRPREGFLHSRVLAGFRVRPEWLWQSPRPRTADVLRDLDR
jgi:Uma2 family endonuclease